MVSDSPKHLLSDKNLKKFGHLEDVTIDDFRIIQVIGIGSYGRVALVQRVVGTDLNRKPDDVGQLYALKIINK